MGLPIEDVVYFLQLASEKGFRNKSLCMMGKQDIHVHRVDMPLIAEKFGFPFDKEIFERIKIHRPTDSYDFFKMFGFSEVHAVDISSYEGADIVFDLTTDLPEDLYNRFDYIIDGGTLEHTFDPAKSIKNMSNMLKKGGFIFHILPLAGYVDHGFYSFSPMMFLDFYHANGFQVRDLRIKSHVSTGKQTQCFYSPDCRIMSRDISNMFIESIYKIGQQDSLICCLAEKMEDGNSNVYPYQVFF